MFFIDFLLVLVIVGLLTAVFSAGFARHRGSSLIGFFLILLLLTWAAGIWIAPIGYPLWGGYWASFLVVGFLFALLLMALIPPSRPVSDVETSAAESDYVIFGTFFWILVVILALVIIAGYLADPFPETGYIGTGYVVPID